MAKVFLIEDHDETLKVWRQKKLKGFDLVHVDAHIDFGYHPARPIKKIFNEARSLKELKANLEYSLSFLRYENDFDKQTHIGNYIYPAMEEGIVRDFYWVIPGRLKEFESSLKDIKKILKGLPGEDVYKSNGIISNRLFGRRFIICILEKLPILKQKVLLDIDTDFLVTDSLSNADNITKIGKRKPWILPLDLVGILKEKIRNPKAITIAYSVNGGYTPIRYKHLGDEIAYRFAPEEVKIKYKNNLESAYYFNLFLAKGKKEYYQKAIKLNSTYRVSDNNYGPLYLSVRKFSQAEGEFLKILKVDSKNPASILGLGIIAWERKNFQKAREYFSCVLRLIRQQLFQKIKQEALLGLAKAEFRLKNLKQAKKLLLSYQETKPLDGEGYYFLGCVFEREKKLPEAVEYYKDAARLGFNEIEALLKLLKISCYLKEQDSIIEFIKARFYRLKKGFLKTKRASLKKKKWIKSLHKFEEKLLIVERGLK